MPSKIVKTYARNPAMRKHRHHRSKKGSQRSLHDGREVRIQRKIKQEELTISQLNELLYENLSQMQENKK